MSIAIQFDTLDYAKKLETTGMPAAQAEQQSRILADVLSKSVAFPGDLKTLERNLDNKLTSLENRFDSKLTHLEARLTGEIAKVDSKVELIKWMMATLIAFNIAIVAKLFLH